MPNEKKDKDPESFSVVDRRRFTAEGDRRQGVETPPAPAQPSPSPSSAPAVESEAARGARQAYEARSGKRAQKIDFETLVLSLSTSAMFQLGLVEDPGQGSFPADLEAARHTIDMLGIIQAKTQGNLTAKEQQLLEQVLYELRLAYVAVSGGQKPRGPKVGR